MKPTIPETGTVVGLDGDSAIVLLKGGGYCKGCGAGKIGLCRPGGRSMQLRARNVPGARAGDIVVVGIEREVRIKGYLLAYVLPLVFLIGGTVLGHIAGSYIAGAWLEVGVGFFALAAAYSYTLRRLRHLDRSSAMAIKKIVCDNVFEPDVKTDEERRFEDYVITR